MAYRLPSCTSSLDELAGAGRLNSAPDVLHDDALSALVNLGYRTADVKEALKRISGGKQPPSLLQEFIREALKELARG